jgi:hypothetical protein
MSYASLANNFEIVNHTHAIPGSIPLIQVIQPGAREAVTTEAVLEVTLQDLLTVLDSACDAGFWFGAVVAPATGAWLFISCICAAETAVHSTWSNQRRSDRICLC